LQEQVEGISISTDKGVRALSAQFEDSMRELRHLISRPTYTEELLTSQQDAPTTMSPPIHISSTIASAFIQLVGFSTQIFVQQFTSPLRLAQAKEQWNQCLQKTEEPINEFIVRLRILQQDTLSPRIPASEPLKVSGTINGYAARLLIDTGSTCTLISEEAVEQLDARNIHKRPDTPNITVRTADNTPLRSKYVVSLSVTINKSTCRHAAYVIHTKTSLYKTFQQTYLYHWSKTFLYHWYGLPRET
ncbi:unnamed protein product, partial [Didymodactylos carnosus]